LLIYLHVRSKMTHFGEFSNSGLNLSNFHFFKQNLDPNLKTVKLFDNSSPFRIISRPPTCFTWSCWCHYITRSKRFFQPFLNLWIIWAIKNRTAVCVAEFIYEHIFCRYLCPGECLIHDRGSEFCNEVMEILRESFGIEIRVIKAGRPMANGQAESAVKNLKSKMKLLSMENGNNF